MQSHPRRANCSSAFIYSSPTVGGICVCVCVLYLVNWTSPCGDGSELGRYVICESLSAICVTARGLARPWGAMELQMETVCELTLPQLKGNQ